MTGRFDTWVTTRRVMNVNTPRYTLTADESTKTWTAVIVYDDTEVILAAPVKFDGTLRGTANAAIAEAAEYIREGLAGTACIEMWKLTQARGLEWDRQAAFVWSEDGRVYADKTGM